MSEVPLSFVRRIRYSRILQEKSFDSKTFWKWNLLYSMILISNSKAFAQ